MSWNLFANTGALGAVAQEPVCSAHLKSWAAEFSPKQYALAQVASLTGLICLTSYLFLFVAFYFATYKKAGTKSKKSKTPSMGTVASNSLVQSEKMLKELPVVPGAN